MQTFAEMRVFSSPRLLDRRNVAVEDRRHPSGMVMGMTLGYNVQRIVCG